MVNSGQKAPCSQSDAGSSCRFVQLVLLNSYTQLGIDTQMNPTGNHNKPLVITVFFTTLNLYPLFTVSASVSNIPTKVLVQGILRALRLDLTGCCVERPLVFASLVRICVVRFTSLEPDFVAVLVRAVLFKGAGGLPRGV